jgi:hypothetical protein
VSGLQTQGGGLKKIFRHRYKKILVIFFNVTFYKKSRAAKNFSPAKAAFFDKKFAA